MWQLVVELQQLMKDLPLYSAHFLAILCELLVGYKESLQILYKGRFNFLSCHQCVLFSTAGLTTVPVESVHSGRHGGGAALGGSGYTQEGVVSSKWAQDEEISSTLKQVFVVCDM